MIKFLILSLVALLPISSAAITSTDFLVKLDNDTLMKIEEIIDVKLKDYIDNYDSALSVDSVKNFFEVIADKTSDNTNMPDTITLTPSQMYVFGYVNNMFNFPYSNVSFYCTTILLWSNPYIPKVCYTKVLRLMLRWYEDNRNYCLDENRINRYKYLAAYSSFSSRASNLLTRKLSDGFFDDLITYLDLFDFVLDMNYANELSEMMIEYFKDKYSLRTDEAQVNSYRFEEPQ